MRGSENDIAEGLIRAAEPGAIRRRFKAGNLLYPYWGYPDHMSESHGQNWNGAIVQFGDRDMNEHDFNHLYWKPTGDILAGKEPYLSAEEVTKIVAEKLVPYENNPKMLDYSLEMLIQKTWPKPLPGK